MRQVTADLSLQGVASTFSATLEDIESFYLDEARRQRMARMGRVRRFIVRVFWLVRSLLMKLTPARRILLALALLMLMPTVHIGGNVDFRIDLQHPLLSAILIVIVLMLELKDKLVARNELVAGRAVQLALMPPATPDVPGWDVWLYTQPANDVGGDLIDHLRIDDRRHGIALGDVAGKALPAALLMVKLQATLRALVPLHTTLDTLGAGVNRILHRDGLPNRFATLVYLILTEGDGAVRYLNAGHLPPLVMRHETGETIEELTGGSIAFGFIAEASFVERHVDLAPGDTLVAVSDGVVEAMNGDGDFFGDDRLRAALAAAAGLSSQVRGEAVLDALRTFVGRAKPHDDVSVVVVRRLPA